MQTPRFLQAAFPLEQKLPVNPVLERAFKNNLADLELGFSAAVVIQRV